ncbi:MAG: VWA domain-containing protein [Novosphingobium sp.]|nr:VWA domain-containing protein [Novosphingobium sp.]
MRSKLLTTAALALALSACATRPSGDEIVLTGSQPRTADAGTAAEPPPPPPPPPPAPVVHQNESIVVTGSASAAPIQSSPAPVTTLDSRGYKLARPSAPSAYIPSVIVPADPGYERYDAEEVSPVKLTSSDPVSTFSVDVDTGAYANSRRFLSAGQLPPKDAVRSEEFVNYFRYDYPLPGSREAPFSVTTDVAATPWNPATRLLRIGLRGYDLPRSQRPPANLVFLVDVSGSMAPADKLPLVKTALARLADELSPRDKVSIVVYAGAAGLVLPATSDKREVVNALERLSAGGSTAGGAGLQLAYQVARDNFIKGGVNRILLATDGDFNVGVSDTKALIDMVEKERDAGVTLTTLGFGQGNYNEALMERVADHGNGNYAYIDSALEAQKVLAEQMSSTLFTIAKDVKIQVEFNPAKVAQYRLLGYENRTLREEDFNNDLVDAGDIGAGHQVTAIYEIVPAGAKGWIEPRRYETPEPAAGARGSELAFVKLRYKLPDGATSRLIERAVPASLLADAAPPRGDMAFATAVAAFGQKLRGDPLLGGLGYERIAAMADGQRDFYRQEFAKLVAMAGSLDSRGREEVAAR